MTMDMDPQSLKAGAAVMIIWGLVDCFFGYRVFKFTVALLGAAIGAILAYHLFAEILGLAGVVKWIGFGLGALVGGILAFGLYLVGIFFLGFTLGFTLVPGLWHAADKGMLLVVGAVAGVVCGIVAMMIQKLLVAAGTAWTGAILVLLGGAFFIEGLDWSRYAASPQEIGVLLSDRPWMLIVFLVLGAAGFLAQLSGHKRAKAKSQKE